MGALSFVRGTIGVATVLVTLVTPAATDAAAIVYTDRALWEAAVGTFVTEDFSSVPDSGLLAPDVEHTLGLLTFSYTGIADAGARPGVLDNRFWVDLHNTGDLGPYVFAFPDPVLAWGADFFGPTSDSGVDITMGGVTVSVSVTPFFGVISDVPFSQVIIAASAHPERDSQQFVMDDVSFGGQTAVPEPATLLLVGGGLAACAARRRRKTRAWE